MKKLNLLLITGLVLLFACGTTLAYSPGIDGPTNYEKSPIIVQNVEQDNGTTAPVPEPATMLLLGSGLVALGVGARKMKK
jgi:hypothetical protein